MDDKGVLPEEAGALEGIVDTGVVAIAHFENPARKATLEFLSEVLSLERRSLIPTSTVIGAYHIMTEYLGVERASACRSLSKTLETRSPALYKDMGVELALDALAYAIGYHIESWDGYLISLAKSFNAPIVYSIDQELARKVREPRIVNPLPQEEFRRYNLWLKEGLEARGP